MSGDAVGLGTGLGAAPAEPDGGQVAVHVAPPRRRRGTTAPRPAEATVSLTEPEGVLLADLEHRIERGLRTFLEVGAALVAIRDGRLYRATHTTFETYLAERWSMSRSYAHRQIAAAEIVETLPIGNIPASESVVRPLAALPPAERPAAWTAAVEAAGDGKVTAKIVQTVVAKRTRPPRAVDDERIAAVAELDSERPRPVAEEERRARRVQRATASLREWRAAFGDLVEFVSVVRSIDQQAATEIANTAVNTTVDVRLKLLHGARWQLEQARMMGPRGHTADRLATAAVIVRSIIKELVVAKDSAEVLGLDPAPPPATIESEWRQVLEGGQPLHVCQGCGRVLHDDEVVEVLECSSESCGMVFDANENGERNCPACNRPFTRLVNRAGCPDCLEDEELVTVETYEEMLAAVQLVGGAS